MRIYQVNYRERRNGDGHGGYSYHGSMREARGAKHEAREWAEAVEIVPLDVKPTKAGILEVLNRHADHPNNG